MLHVEGLRYAYAGRPALDGIDLAIEPGEICALIGPNGAGKSTLIRVICGRLAPQAGSVRIAGGDPATDPRARASIGLAPQDVALYPKLTVRENLKAFSDLAGSRPTGAPVGIGRALVMARADSLADRRVETLSGGERRRANVAAALVGEPRLLVLDEPTVGVDAEARLVIHDALRAIRSQGVAILIATHDLEQAEIVADRVALIDRGRIVRCGPLNRLVAETFGTDAVEVTALLAVEPVGRQRDTLLALGLRPFDGALSWRALTPGREEALRLQAALSGLPGGVRELRMRGAGLAALVARHVVPSASVVS